MMVQKNKWIQRFFAVLTMLVFLTGISVLTVYADEGDGSESVITDDGANTDEGNPDASVDSGESSQNADSAGSVSDIEHGEVDNGMGTNDDNNADNQNGGNQDSDSNDSSSSSSRALQSEVERLKEYYLNNAEDLPEDISQYVPNEYLNYLPTVTSDDVEIATAEPLPDVAVSDATLFSGIVMWVCVAVGISVVVGVMVSKRTHRKSV